VLAKRLRLIGGSRRFWDLPIITGPSTTRVFMATASRPLSLMEKPNPLPHRRRGPFVSGRGLGGAQFHLWLALLSSLFEPLWPDFYTLETLNRQKALMSDVEWACLYDGNPVPQEGSVIKKDWLKHRWTVFPTVKGSGPLDLQEAPELAGDPMAPAPAGVPSESKVGTLFRRTVVSVDSAEKDNQRADYTAITVWREGMDRYHYLIDAQRERMEFPRLVEAVNAMATRWAADYVLMEEKGAGNQYIQHMEAEVREGRAPGFMVTGINPGRDGKIFRMDSVSPFFKQGRVVLPERAPWLAHLERELLLFPGGKNDDYPDSISQYLKWARDTSTIRRGSAKLKGHGTGRRRA
jgi:predicted phage terminase large subunit-like protein